MIPDTNFSLLQHCKVHRGWILYYFIPALFSLWNSEWKTWRESSGKMTRFTICGKRLVITCYGLNMKIPLKYPLLFGDALANWWRLMNKATDEASLGWGVAFTVFASSYHEVSSCTHLSTILPHTTGPETVLLIIMDWHICSKAVL